ncbi:MAG: hypothetical protein AAB393_11165, partial [Bacteroidota bacterium]
APPASNLVLIQRLCKEVTDTAAEFVTSGDSVRVTVFPRESAWYVEGTLLEAISERRRWPTQSLTAPFEMELGVLRVEITYANIRRRSLFSAKVLDRTVSTEVAAKVVDRRSGSILMSSTIMKTLSDVVEVSEIEKLESQSIPMTRGALPKEGFFSSILEPLVAIGAVAVAIYLLFHVRS